MWSLHDDRCHHTRHHLHLSRYGKPCAVCHPKDGQALSAGISERGQALFAVPGGRTPAAFLSHLSRASLPWDRIVVTLTDERWVGTDNPDSNEAMVRRHLLVGPAAKMRLVSLYSAAPTPEAGLNDVDRSLSTYADPFDLVVLGMGDDGHIASLFPGEDTWPHAARIRVMCGSAGASGWPGAPLPDFGAPASCTCSHRAGDR